MTEETRAAAYRVSLVRRRAAELTRYRLLAGSEVAARAVRAAWRPFQDFIREQGDDRERQAGSCD